MDAATDMLVCPISGFCSGRVLTEDEVQEFDVIDVCSTCRDWLGCATMYCRLRPDLLPAQEAAQLRGRVDDELEPLYGTGKLCRKC